MKFLLLFSVVVLSSLSLSAKDYKATSPNGLISVTVSDANGLSWVLSKGSEILLDKSYVNLKFINKSSNYRVVGSSIKKFDEVSEAVVPTKFKSLHNVFNELRLKLSGGVSLVYRLFDNGVAYRFESNIGGVVKVESEQAEFNFYSDCKTRWPREQNPDFISHCEGFFDDVNISAIQAPKYAYLPVYFSTPNGTKLVITETNLADYPGLFLFGGHGTKLSAKFPAVVLESKLKDGSDRNEEFLKKADYIASTNGKRVYPWRIITINDNDKELLENYLAYQLAEPSVKGDYSWIKPGKISWDWWNSWNLYGVDFKAGVNTKTYKYYIDFAAKYGLDYILLDEGWSVSTLNIKEPREGLDLQEIIRYGKEKGIGVILWTLWNPMKKDLTGILDRYVEWGVKGIKIDFMQRSDQEMVNFYEEIASACFQRHLLVDYHGSFKPAGLQRKYPNVMSFEGVYGMEHDKCSTDISPEHDCILPFTRMVAGPMDYTPGATINATKADFSISWDHPMSQGTRAHQAALFVVFESAVQMFCDSPSNYLRNDEYTSFIAQMPTVWDETVALHGSIGEYVAIARRNGDKWYIGAITNWTGRDLEIDFSFLGSGSYSMECFGDGVNADTFAQDYRISKSNVKASDKMVVHLANGGGWTAILTPKR